MTVDPKVGVLILLILPFLQCLGSTVES